jgi:hypothetical protein
MPIGVYKHKKASKPTRLKMSLAKKGKMPKNILLLHKLTKGRKMSEEQKKFISSTNTKKWEELKCIHYKIEKKLGTPKYCEHCKKTDKKVYDWSNKDHKYSSKIKDWQRLCRSCHLKYDYKFNNRVRTPGNQYTSKKINEIKETLN